MHKFIKKDQATLRQIAPNKSALNYITKDLSPNLSFATTEGVDFSETEVCKYDRIYFVLEGRLVIEVEGETELLEADDACYLGKGIEYTMSGTFKTVVVNSPAFGNL